MEPDTKKKCNVQPNLLLRRQRKLRNWTLNDVANELDRLCEEGEGSERGIINANMVGSWERGKHVPSLFWRRKLCKLYRLSAEDLGLVEPLPPQEPLSPVVSSSEQFVSPVFLRRIHQAIDLLREAPEAPTEQQLGAWLAVVATDLASLFESNWSLEDILASLQVLLKGVQAMSTFSRRKLLQLGVAAVVSRVAIPEGRHISVEDRTKLHSALGESIGAGWKLFHTAGNAQVVAVGYAHLYLVQQASSHLYPSVRPLFYSSVYNLIGAAQHFQGRYDEAFQAHERAYVAALEGIDVWNMAQSRSWQANGLREQQRYSEALQTIEAALRLIAQQHDTESIRLRAHLLASGAENAAFLGETKSVHKHLDASEALLELLPPTYTEEFDHASWHQYSGTCALILKQYEHASEELVRAIDTLPQQWLVRHATALMPLAIVYARQRERDRCVEIAKKAAQVVKAMNAPSLNRQFVEYLEQEILSSFPGDSHISTFVTDARQQLLATPASAHID